MRLPCFAISSRVQSASPCKTQLTSAAYATRRALKEVYDEARLKRHRSEQVAIACAKTNFQHCTEDCISYDGCKYRARDLRVKEKEARERLKGYHRLSKERYKKILQEKEK